MRFIPTCAAIFAALTAGFGLLIAFFRRDARREVTESLEKKDLENAKELSDRVSNDRINPDRVQPWRDAGYRD